MTYIVILATCFDSYESSSDINIQELLVHIVLQLSPGFVMHKGIPIAIVRLRHKKLRQYVLVVLEY
jgi:ABC-type proline/glycine betaine transport system permease subunit